MMYSVRWILLILLLPAGGALAETKSAYESVRESTDLLLTRLVEVQPLYDDDPERFFAEVQSALDPYVDFESFAKGVMARHYGSATEAQKRQFEARFRDALIRNYAVALLAFDHQEVIVRRPEAAQEKPDRASIVIEVHGKSGTVYPIRYQLRLDEDRWLLRNVIVNGINVGLQFKSQFNAYVQQYKGDIDKVIENWSADLARAA